MQKNLMLLYWLVMIIIALVTGCGGSGGGNSYTVSGQVTDTNGTLMPGARINFSNGAFYDTVNGLWTEPGLSGTMVITPINAGWTFSPKSVTVTGAESNIVFVGSTSQSYAISGKITDTSGSPISNITVQFSGGFASTTTGSDGLWSKNNVMGIAQNHPAKQ